MILKRSTYKLLRIYLDIGEACIFSQMECKCSVQHERGTSGTEQNYSKPVSDE